MVMCVVKGCDNKSKVYSTVMFHRIPTKNDMLKYQWLATLNIDHKTPLETIKKWRVCSEHFQPDDYYWVNMDSPTGRRLKDTAIPTIFRMQAGPSGSSPMTETEIDPESQSIDDSFDFEDEEAYFDDDDDIQSTVGRQKNPRSCPGERLQSRLILTVTNPSTEPTTPPSVFGTYYALSPTWYYQMDDPSKIGLHMEEPFNENVNMDFVANKEAGGFLNHELSKGHSHVCRRSRPEKRNPLSQDRGSKRSAPGSPEDATDSDNEDKDINTEENAQCSEELVITKVEDLSNETEFDQNENYSGKMDMDEPEDSEALRAKGLKSRPAHSSAVTQTQAADKRFAGFDPSDVLPVKIKDEPMDEEWKKAPQSPLRSIKDDEDFDQQRLGSYHQVPGVNNASTGAQTESIQNFKRLGVLCTACNKVLLKGQTAFQRSGSAKIYCSLECLRSTKNKACHHCLKEIHEDSSIIVAPVDMSGAGKEFCSQKCRNALTFKCSVCQKAGIRHVHEVNFRGSIQKLCSDGCFNQFRSSNKLNMNSCVNCGGFCYGTDAQCPSLRMEDRVMKFCSQTCLTAYKKRSLKLVTCKTCHALRPAEDALDSPNAEGIRELFCSVSCVTASKDQTVGLSAAPVECNNCKLKLVPQYHIAMSEGSVQNFCTFSCVVAYQESLNNKKANTQVNTVTSTSSNTTTAAKTAAPKPASSESSSAAKTSTPSGQGQNVTKIPCCQCLNAFFHKPELMEYKRKMYAFCGNDCIDEFRKVNRVVARCENCNLNKRVKVVRRINRVDRSFCEEKCRALFEQNLVKRWGTKHCSNCFHCNSTSKTVVTEVFNGKQEEFCGSDCLSQHNLLIRQEIKCSMCRQIKKMNESVKWLGEMKHFCSLRCLMFFCSLQGITGAVIKATSKSLATQCAKPMSSAVTQKPKEATPVIASVVSLSGPSSKQPGVSGNTNAKGSVQTDVTMKHKRNLRSQILQNKSPSKNKSTTCKPHTADAEIQKDEAPKVIVLPVPVPVYVPVPMNLYSQYVPKSVGMPLPVPVPLFFPTTLDSAEHIVQTIQEIKEKIPDDPLEADLIMMAEMVAEDAEKEKHISSCDQTDNIMEDLDLQDLSSNLSWEEDPVSPAQILDQTPEPEPPPPPPPPAPASTPTPTFAPASTPTFAPASTPTPTFAPVSTPTFAPAPSSRSATMTLVSTKAGEPLMDLEADFPIETIALLREQMENDSGKRRSCKKGPDVSTQKKRGRKCASVPSNILSKLQHEYGVKAWRDWVRWKNAQPNSDAPKFGSRSMTLKEDVLKCCTAELSYGLCKFITEVRRPNGEKYSPDSIYYLCLGIQQYLFENNRMENIFSDVFYTKFCWEMSNILKGWKPTILPNGYIHSRVEEEFLWNCKQLGAFSPGVLLNTLIYFFTKYFNYRTVEQHRLLSFAHVKRYTRGPANAKVSFLRFYPPKEDSSDDGVPAKKRKKDDERQRVLKIGQNSDNPLHCPVRLYEFYLSKCSPGIRHHATKFYLSPERSCVPSSPTWFSISALSDEALDSMLSRILTVRELHMETEQTPADTDSDSDSDYNQF
ncbi:uncharacterized protein isoform X2 [Danio rerio]|uniref:Uncharacterized protein isoform X2 n=1 Tax=Danio rerio TaxID=7955 RepID=A0A8M2B6C3_DANRE|nr:uncharacterized protein LOC553317 isoform X2 [Danio rerio]|eukprot:XP_005159757.1 uncharacterized protein LOC553317 isoform X2 [Danio rerio]